MHHGIAFQKLNIFFVRIAHCSLRQQPFNQRNELCSTSMHMHNANISKYLCKESERCISIECQCTCIFERNHIRCFHTEVEGANVSTFVPLTFCVQNVNSANQRISVQFTILQSKCNHKLTQCKNTKQII